MTHQTPGNRFSFFSRMVPVVQGIFLQGLDISVVERFCFSHGRTDNICENNDPYSAMARWVKKVYDKLKFWEFRDKKWLFLKKLNSKALCSSYRKRV